MKKFNSETSRDSLDNSHAKVNPVKVKSATFGAVNRVPKPINRPKSPAPKAFLTKKNSQANVPPKISPRTFNNNNKNTRQDRTKMMMEKRKASKKNYEDTKKKLEVNKQPSELESKKIVEVPRETPRKDLEQRRRSLQYKRNEGKGEKEKLSSRNTNKNKQDEIVKIGSERSRRKSEISKTLKKDIKKSSLKDIDELKSLKMEGKASSRINATDKKNFRPKETSKETISEASIISSNAEISDEVVTQMERQISEVEDANVASNTPKGEELLEVKIEVSGGGVTEEELRKEVIFSNDQLADVVNDDKSNSESINVESEDHDKISEGKIDLFIKNIDDLEKGENNVLIGSVTKEKIVSGVNENSMFATIKEESLPTDDLTDNTEKTDNFLIVDEKSVEIDGSKNLSVTKDVEIINADDENGHLLTEDKLYHDAATKIQSLIKGHLVRKILKENKSGVIEGEIIKTGDQSTLIELTNAENIVSDKLENDEKSQPMIVEEKVMLIRDKGDLENINEESEHVKHTLNKINAIIKIQALVRGYLTRKSLTKNNIENVENKPSVGVENSVPPSESTAVKMDVPRAASIIQAVVRGFLIRRSIRKAVKNNIPTGSGDDKQKSETPDNICKDMKDEQREELTIESVLQGIVEDVEVYKRITTDFLGQEHINYDSERYDNLSRNLKENSIEETKADIGENIVKNEIENELQIFDRKDAFGDDVKPRANSIEKIANVPNYGDEITAKIQSDWQDHRMKRSLEVS